MKKILIIALLMFSSLSLSACTDQVGEVSFFYVNDYKTDVKGFSGGEIDLFDKVRVFNDGVDVTNKAKVSIYDLYNKKNVNKVTDEVAGKYEITYSYGSFKESCIITVGNDTVHLGLYDYVAITNDYQLVWSDEFNGTSLDDANWNYEEGNGDWGWGNGELQYYTRNEKNVKVEDGKLKITALHESMGAQEYTSARITTEGKQAFTYGKIEASIKLPAGVGTWAAFWMLAENNNWPYTGEIDIMEHVGYDQDNVHANNHTEKNYGANLNGTGGATFVQNSTSEFHTYTLEWLPDKMIYSIDGVVFHEYYPIDAYGQLHQESWPFNNDFFIIFNLAIGGAWGGQQGVDNSALPATMEVDYVRVSQSNILKNFLGA